jgi:hypothetical protein
MPHNRDAGSSAAISYLERLAIPMKYTYTAIPDSHIQEASLAILALIRRGAHQPVAMDQGRRPASRRCSEDDARVCSEVQRREDRASRSCRRCGPPDEEL